MKRSVRSLVARIAIVGIVFAQVATAAFAVPEASVRAAEAGVPAGFPASAGAGHCAGSTTLPPAPPANVCEVHCTDVAASPLAPDLPPVVLVALPVDLVPLSARAVPMESGRSPCAALPCAPPPALEFCRLLI